MSPTTVLSSSWEDIVARQHHLDIDGDAPS